MQSEFLDKSILEVVSIAVLERDTAVAEQADGVGLMACLNGIVEFEALARRRRWRAIGEPFAKETIHTRGWQFLVEVAVEAASSL